VVRVENHSETDNILLLRKKWFVESNFAFWEILKKCTIRFGIASLSRLYTCDGIQMAAQSLQRKPQRVFIDFHSAMLFFT